jgi:hypothetical protein
MMAIILYVVDIVDERSVRAAVFVQEQEATSNQGGNMDVSSLAKERARRLRRVDVNATDVDLLVRSQFV